MNNNERLLAPYTDNNLDLKNRIVMAPMSRRRTINNIPEPYVQDYYVQRSGAGLIIAENVAVAPEGVGYMQIPGFYNEEQYTAWAAVARAVHAGGGKIFLQLVHTGRIGHPENNPGKAAPVAPSPIAAKGELSIPAGFQVPYPEPVELTTAAVKVRVQQFVTAAKMAMAAGFDGVEIHGAHGFLLDQFLNPNSNTRSDEYGGDIVRRSGLLLEVVTEVAKAIGREHTGIRLSPFARLYDMNAYPEEEATHLRLADELNRLGILYVHFSDQPVNGERSIPEDFIRKFRVRFKHLMILAGGYTPATGNAALEKDLGDLIAFGRPFIANPDLPERIRLQLPLAVPDGDTFYHGGTKGLIDYPVFAPVALQV
ncbi:alkene reductase [Chitinophaga sp. Cy-1792]|uniref:alkene reductase n=1 Tax=Chitinophaga sp. Cy-1792 TaxID=2608339 RepID=UPI0014223044|nr:alkene reductase [Chitinophaga sp. Cy-1792]NIG55975.1 alkene reductase [Chitinophaga sp. Cy-1792]